LVDGMVWLKVGFYFWTPPPPPIPVQLYKSTLQSYKHKDLS